jgi:thiol:disulfide interchange protein
VLERSEFAFGDVDELEGALVAPDGRAWDEAGAVRAMYVNVPVTGAPVATAAAAAGGGDTVAPTLLLALLLALVGGLLLNLMPCVFPVISLKVLSFVKQGGEDPAKVRSHGLVFGAGVLASFWALAGVLLALRAAGSVSGWGFQLQSPAFVAVMTLLLFAVGLSLMGVFSISVSCSRAGATAGSGYGGSFSSGILATLLATPCTAPFMGAALGFTLTQPAAVALLVFTALGLGMALPYVVLSMSPRLLRYMPRPGAWMETLRQALAFPMFAAAVWLLWVFGLQAGMDAVAILLVAILILSFGAWILGRWGGLHLNAGTRAAGRIGAAVAVILAVGLAVTGARSGEPAVAAAGAAVGWEVYSAERVDVLRAEGQPVFIDFTAAWCITCQVNKRVALSTQEVQDAFRDRDVALLRADWTARDENITRALESYGRNGVPLYVLHPGGDAPPVLLPEVLTRQVVIDHLNRLPDTRQAAR